MSSQALDEIGRAIWDYAWMARLRWAKDRVTAVAEGAMSGDDPDENLAERLERETARAKSLAKQLGERARDIAAAEDAVAETREQLAETHPRKGRTVRGRS